MSTSYLSNFAIGPGAVVQTIYKQVIGPYTFSGGSALSNSSTAFNNNDGYLINVPGQDAFSVNFKPIYPDSHVLIQVHITARNTGTSSGIVAVFENEFCVGTKTIYSYSPSSLVLLRTSPGSKLYTVRGASIYGDFIINRSTLLYESIPTHLSSFIIQEIKA